MSPYCFRLFVKPAVSRANCTVKKTALYVFKKKKDCMTFSTKISSLKVLLWGFFKSRFDCALFITFFPHPEIFPILIFSCLYFLVLTIFYV